ncbi:MAG: hypothetical protein JNJ82_08420 [Opitutaceae bacterium]|jgi:hypothetical protein|nr:hypothetical protein [Opitutaceae bacterium]
MKTPLVTHLGQPSWTLQNGSVSARVTRTAGMLGPVEFRLPDQRRISPLAVAPWAGETLPPGLPPLLHALRGDFFCAPFGGNGTAYRGEQHPPHGESANRDWTLDATSQAGDARTLHAHLTTKVRPGRIDKRLTVREGHTAVYCEHIMHGFRGSMPLGTHPCIAFPAEEGAGRVSVGGWAWGQVLPMPFELPAQRGYSSLEVGARFRSLDRVPLAVGGFADLSRYPARKGFEDLVMLVGAGKGAFGWSAVAFPDQRYVFLQVKNPRILRHTVLWHSHGGRHYAPWNGRHTSVLGLEEVTSYFHLGLAESVKDNPMNMKGIDTAVTFPQRRPLRVAHILAVVAIPRGFDQVADVRSVPGGAELVAASGVSVRTPLDLGFVADS